MEKEVTFEDVQELASKLKNPCLILGVERNEEGMKTFQTVQIMKVEELLSGVAMIRYVADGLVKESLDGIRK